MFRPPCAARGPQPSRLLGLAAAAARARRLVFGGGELGARPRPSEAVPGTPSVEIVSPRNGARQTSHAVVVKVDGRELPPGAAPVRRRTAARRGPHPLQPQPRPRLRRPEETAATRSTARSATAAWSAPPSTTRRYAGPNGVLAERIGSAGSYSPATRPEIFYQRPAARLLPPGRHPRPEQRHDDARSTTSPTSRSSPAPATDAETVRGRQGPQRQGRRAARRLSRLDAASAAQVDSRCPILHFV